MLVWVRCKLCFKACWDLSQWKEGNEVEGASRAPTKEGLDLSSQGTAALQVRHCITWDRHAKFWLGLGQNWPQRKSIERLRHSEIQHLVSYKYWPRDAPMVRGRPARDPDIVFCLVMRDNLEMRPNFIKQISQCKCLKRSIGHHIRHHQSSKPFSLMGITVLVFVSHSQFQNIFIENGANVVS